MTLDLNTCKLHYKKNQLKPKKNLKAFSSPYTYICTLVYNNMCIYISTSVIVGIFKHDQKTPMNILVSETDNAV